MAELLWVAELQQRRCQRKGDELNSNCKTRLLFACIILFGGEVVKS